MNCTLKFPHKNNQKLPIKRDFRCKKAVIHHFLLKIRTFFLFFFAENVVLLIFAQRNQNIFYSHNLFFKILHYEQD